ncbi:serine/threonine-protein kinase [Streptomyces sp. NPDC050658]|uniref:serine/threonine-protein kinase n=1 Tax=unclassified Streptomyces TaxID=2593676 RepID=UPI00343DD357
MGEVFAGRYELVDPVGRGGAGAVWRAWDHRRRRYVAAKVLQQSDAHTLLRFVREQALRIDHPHVLAPASWAADDDKVLFTMALVAGGSLAHLVGDYGPLPPHLACTLLDQLLAGLAAVHAEGVVHRDIKPANILLESTGIGRPHLRLSDFGISMRLGEPRLTETNYVVGTPGYFAPEQMLGAEPDFTADLFAVGLVALYLLQGAKPDSKALIERFAAHGTPGAPQGVPEPLWQVVATLLQPDPQARFRTATGARKALVSAAELLPEPGPDDELVEIFDQLGPLPQGFGPEGPLTTSPQLQVAPSPTPPPYAPSPESGSFRLPPPPQAPTPPPHAPTPPPQAAPPQAPPQQPAQAPPPQQPTPTPPPARPVQPAPTPAPTPTPAVTPAQPAQPAQAPQPPPQPAPAQPAQPAHAALYPHDASPRQDAAHEPPQAVPPAVHHSYAPTHPYTAHGPQVPLQRRPIPRRRPGPPAKVAIPMLLAALACFAVGFWALSQT